MEQIANSPAIELTPYEALCSHLLERVLETLKKQTAWTRTMKIESLAAGVTNRGIELERAEKSYRDLTAANAGKRRIASRVQEQADALAWLEKCRAAHAECVKAQEAYSGELEPNRADAIAKLESLVQDFERIFTD